MRVLELLLKKIMRQKKKENKKNITGNPILLMDSFVFEKSIGKSFKKSFFLNFLIAFFFLSGISGLIINAYDFECSIEILILTEFILTFIFSFSYYSKLCLSTVHISLFIIIAVYISVNIQELYYGINSVLNILIRSVNSVMSLPFVRTYDEDFSSRTTNITAFFLVIIFFVTMIYSFFLAKEKTLLLSAVITMIVLEFASYLHNDIGMFYPSMIIISFILMLLKKHANMIPYSLKKPLKQINNEKAGFHVFNTDIKLKSTIYTALFIFSLSFIVFKAADFVVSDKFYSTNSALKNITDHYVYMVAWKGFDNLKDDANMENTGGLNNGTFGNVKEIIYDNKVDLTITFVPNSRNPVYIPTFMGETYDSNNRKWISSNAYLSSNAYNSAYLSTYQTLKNLIVYKKTADDDSYATYNPDYIKVGEGTMTIKNVSLSDGILPLPYYSADNSEFYKIEIDEEREIDYVATQYTYSEINNLVKDHKELLDSIYTTTYHNYDMSYTIMDMSKYLEIPDEQYKFIEKFCRKNDISGTSEEVINKIKDVFTDDYSYTLSPGVTPEDEDFVDYFLNEQKSGFCVHFASAACLLLRYNNIPARYAEGYIVDNEAYKSSKTIKLEEGESYEDYYDGYSDLSTRMITVELPDSNAHAWVEVYVNGFGWIPVEFTLGYYNDNSNDVNTIINNATGSIFDRLKNMRFISYILNKYAYVSGNIIYIVPICFLTIAIFYKFAMNYRLYYVPDDICAKNQYNLILKIVRKELCKKNSKYKDSIITHENLIVLLKREFAMNDINTLRLIRSYEEFLFYDKHKVRISRINDRFCRFIKDFSSKCGIFKMILLRFGCIKIFRNINPYTRRIINGFVRGLKKPARLIRRITEHLSASQ